MRCKEIWRANQFPINPGLFASINILPWQPAPCHPLVPANGPIVGLPKQLEAYITLSGAGGIPRKIWKGKVAMFS